MLAWRPSKFLARRCKKVGSPDFGMSAWRAGLLCDGATGSAQEPICWFPRQRQSAAQRRPKAPAACCSASPFVRVVQPTIPTRSPTGTEACALGHVLE
jgi:hypothetical protein